MNGFTTDRSLHFPHFYAAALSRVNKAKHNGDGSSLGAEMNPADCFCADLS